jgi:hypothetical protein
VDSNRGEWRAWVSNWDQRGSRSKIYLHYREIFLRSDVDVIFYRNARPTDMDFECRNCVAATVSLALAQCLRRSRWSPETKLSRTPRALILGGAGYRTKKREARSVRFSFLRTARCQSLMLNARYGPEMDTISSRISSVRATRRGSSLRRLSYGVKWNVDLKVRILATHLGAQQPSWRDRKQKGSGTILQLWNRTGALS